MEDGLHGLRRLRHNSTAVKLLFMSVFFFSTNILLEKRLGDVISIDAYRAMHVFRTAPSGNAR